MVKTFDVLIEIPKGSRNKYEYDFKPQKIRFNPMLFGRIIYPTDSEAYAGDPLGVLLLGHQPIFPM